MIDLQNISQGGGSIVELVSRLRDIEKHNDREMFRQTMRRVGLLVANELSKTFTYQAVPITTPLAQTTGHQLSAPPVVATILRAGLPLYEGVLDVFTGADSAFVAAYRKHDADGSFKIAVNYCTCPDLSGRSLILADPMIATGSSLIDGLEVLFEQGGQPDEVHIIAAIGAEPGVHMVQTKLEQYGLKRASIWCAAIDPELDENKYIVPGLGDAGDLAFGPKKQA